MSFKAGGIAYTFCSPHRGLPRQPWPGHHQPALRERLIIVRRRPAAGRFRIESPLSSSSAADLILQRFDEIGDHGPVGGLDDRHAGNQLDLAKTCHLGMCGRDANGVVADAGALSVVVSGEVRSTVPLICERGAG
ncbi:hypothetical protein NKI09_20455 [Mesorhizobium sp. M0757]|uniref:hypothetical protein n=1 Tax=unclassified Mesorhizobium TaxID=325217 RepID=UPI0033378310